MPRVFTAAPPELSLPTLDDEGPAGAGAARRRKRKAKPKKKKNKQPLPPQQQEQQQQQQPDGQQPASEASNAAVEPHSRPVARPVAAASAVQTQPTAPAEVASDGPLVITVEATPGGPAASPRLSVADGRCSVTFRVQVRTVRAWWPCGSAAAACLHAFISCSLRRPRGPKLCCAATAPSSAGATLLWRPPSTAPRRARTSLPPTRRSKPAHAHRRPASRPCSRRTRC